MPFVQLPISLDGKKTAECSSPTLLRKKACQVASTPLLPLDHKGLTRTDAADFFRGLADLIEVYPTEGVVVTLHVEAAVTGPATAKPRKKPVSR